MLGSNFFLEPGYNGGIRVIDDSSRKWLILTQRLFNNWLCPSTPVSIKEIGLHNFSIDSPFTKITNNIFQLSSCSTNGQCTCVNPEKASRRKVTRCVTYKMEVLIAFIE